jgi:putative FmdB family regulatory protein
MPIYEYLCHACGKKTELLQRMGADPITTCPECGGEVRKLISSPAVQFKGTGWYVTDYGKKGAGKSGESGKSGDGGKSGESAKSGDGGGASGESGKSGGESKSEKSSSESSSSASSGTSETKAAKASGSD